MYFVLYFVTKIRIKYLIYILYINYKIIMYILVNIENNS